MKVAIKGKRLKEGVRYHGIVSQYKTTQSKLIISVIFNRDPDTEYIKSVQINENINSPFVKLAESLGIIDDDGNVDTDYLEDLHVIANLQKGYDKCFYVDKMTIDEKYYDESMQAEEAKA